MQDTNATKRPPAPPGSSNSDSNHDRYRYGGECRDQNSGRGDEEVVASSIGTNNTEVDYLVALTLLLICPVIVKGVILMVHIDNVLYV